MKFEIGAYITIFTAIIAAYLAYRNQLRLRAFEIFLSRRDSVLSDTEKYIQRLYLARDAFEGDISDKDINKYIRELNHDGLILYHKAKGGNFGALASLLLDTFCHCLQEPLVNRALSKNIDLIDWIGRTTNGLTAFYGFAHSQVSKEIEIVAFSLFGRLRRKHLSRLRVEKREIKESKVGTNHSIQADAAEPRG